MPRSASTGVYTAPSNTFNPAVSDTVISSTAWNATSADYVTALAHTASTTRALYPTTGQVQDGGFLWGGTAGGTADALTITLTPAITAYAAGQRFRFILGASQNTGSGVTLAVNGLTPQTVKRRDNTSLSAGDLPSSALIDLTYDGTVFRINGLVASQVATNIPRSSRTSGTMLGINDKGTLVTVGSGTFTQTFDRTATLGDGWWLYYQNSGSGTIKARSVGGADSILNGGFATSADWTTGIGWTISAGVANASVASASLSQAQTLVTGQVYRLTYTVTRSAGTVTPRFIGGTTVTGTARSTAGTFEEYLTAVSGNNTIDFLGAGFTGTIDVISMVAVDLLDGLEEYDIYPSETRLFQCNGVNIASVLIQGGTVTFSSDVTFIWPPKITFAYVEVVGGGGGGGGGCGQAASSARPGGSGGGGGALNYTVLTAGAAGSTVAITVGAGGTSGAGGVSANGSNGGAGGTSSFGSALKSFGGGGGAGGLTGTNVSGGGGGGTGGVGGAGSSGVALGGLPRSAGSGSGDTLTGATQSTRNNSGGGGGACTTSTSGGNAEWGGGAGGSSLGNGSGCNNSGSSIHGGGAGGGGGGIVVANTPANGAAGGLSGSFDVGGGGAGGTGSAGMAGTAGTAGANGLSGSGGGGGAPHTAGTGGVGGAGGAAGGGGGGGGAGTSTGGAGGVGGAGEIRIRMW
jgi:hypothetical protein